MSRPSQPYFKVVKNEAKREATVYIYGIIGGFDMDTFESINTAEKFRKDFEAAESEADTVHVHINSPGGYIDEGMAIYNMLYASEKNIITYNDGLCASMAGLILLAGDKVKAFKNAAFMVHNCSSIYFGNKKEVEDQLAAADVFDRALGTAIEERLNITQEAVAEKYLNYKDNWFDAKTALAEGFYDEIIEKKAKEMPKNVMQMNSEQMFHQYAAMAISFPTDTTKPENTMSKPNSYPQMEAVLGLESPLAVNENGSFLNEQQKFAVENKLSAQATALKNANDAKASAEANLATSTSAHATSLQTEKDARTAIVASLKAAAILAGVEGLAEDADATDISTALTAKIEELNGKPGATHTGSPHEDPKPTAHSYLDFENSSVYSQIQSQN